jgi:hypothetical protein
MAQAAQALGMNPVTLRRRVSEGRMDAVCRDASGNEVEPLLDANGRRIAPPGTTWWIEVADPLIEAMHRRRADEAASSFGADLAGLRIAARQLLARIEAMEKRLAETLDEDDGPLVGYR